MSNFYSEANRQHSSCNQGYQCGQIDIAKRLMAQRHVAAFPRISNGAG